MIPEIIKLLAQETRWQLITLLAESDYRVHELAEALHTQLNQVSYHLGLLREGGLVNERRSSADGRDVYYALNVERVQALYWQAGAMLHPALTVADAPAPKAVNLDAPRRILVLCTHNSARSQMAEGLLRHLGKGKIEVFSAGTEVTQVNPMAIRVMAQHGIDITSHTSKHLDQFLDQSFDYVITVCDSARELCPIFPNAAKQIHWSFPDPSAVVDPDERYRAFETVARQLTTRIQYLLIILQREVAHSHV